jgi:hypothetical protein
MYIKIPDILDEGRLDFVEESCEARRLMLVRLPLRDSPVTVRVYRSGGRCSSVHDLRSNLHLRAVRCEPVSPIREGPQRPVLPIPHFCGFKLGINLATGGLWISFQRQMKSVPQNVFSYSLSL